ncbi:hydroxymethylbilane synthase [Flavobacterium magnum]|uniref:Hydroxymethylbilane synthase n=1 Tax=Flavobacterium magnum TaxID=2162713 RepID=A0A2S0RBU1_9FLAO|nr:hydroxymethylbilane synthase [Flavobacterium magnum]AWA29183.1 hydroxymethylbilane synthase [Flavobacterium magnum]
MSKTIRIGTRDSELALWQAHTVEKKLNDLGYSTEIIAVKSAGDIILDKPLYELGITGIFTKTLDIAMINGQVDIAVHSMKDVPTALPKGIVQAAVLERANEKDILVYNGNEDFYHENATIATGSLRRQAQWLNRFPHHTTVDLRGNVNTRLQKLKDNKWNGAIFAAAGLERLNLKPENHIDLDWMIPAPAQGAMVVVSMQHDDYCTEAVAKLNHFHTEICTKIERDFLKQLEGGCTAPIGALAEIIGNDIRFTGVLCSLDGKEKINIEKAIAIDQYHHFGNQCAVEILENGGEAVMEKIRKDLNK